MELWIRSQDRELLILAEHLDIYNVSVDCELYGIEESGVDIGIYSTKKRALEVLDEIQDLMRSLCDSDLKIIQYEMPKE